MERNGDHSSSADRFIKMLRRKTYVYKWIERFRGGREAVKDDEGRGRPTTSKNNEKIDFVRNLVKEDGRLTVYQIAETVGISVGSAHSILHDDSSLNKLLAPWVPTWRISYADC